VEKTFLKMDTAALLEQAQLQAAQDEILQPVAKWGGILSPQAQRFFHDGYEVAGAEVSAELEGRYFLEVLRLTDPANLKAGLSTLHSIVRGYSKYYACLLDGTIIDILMKFTRAADASIPDKAAYLLSGLMARYPGKFTNENVAMVLKYSGTEFGKLDVVANLLKFDGYRADIWKLEGKRVLSGLESSSIPVIYKALFCVWLVGFNDVLLKGSVPTNIIKAINAVIQGNRTEKIIRIALQAIENLLKSKPM